MKIVLLNISVLFILGCINQKKIVEGAESEVKIDYFQNSFSIQQNTITEDKIRIDSLIKELLQSDFRICHYHPNYESTREYLIGHNKLLDELAFLHRKSLKNEEYIFRTVLRDREFRKKQNDCYNCIMVFRKRDCDEKENNLRLNMLPYIVKDTSNTKNSIEIIKHISVILDEPCERTQHHIRTEVEWRRKLFTSLKYQIPFVRKYNSDEDGDLGYIYDAMAQLPDSLTTDFAFRYLMKDTIPDTFDELPWGILDILEFSIRYEKKYTYFDGSQINLTNNKIDSLKYRIKSLNSKSSCDWCEETMGILNDIKMINIRNAYH